MSRQPFRENPVSRRAASPARRLDDAVKLCDPSTPLHPTLDAALREDLDAVRGGDRLGRVARNIRRSGGIPTLHFLTGHVGSGKTTELLRMRETLARPVGDEPERTVLYLDADAMLDRYDVDLEDILVGLWRTIASDHPKALAAMKPVWKERIAIGLQAAALDLPKAVAEAVDALGRILRLASPEKRRELRSALTPLLGPLLEGINLALREARADDAGEVVVLLDNLEKLAEGQEDAVKRLYVERMGALKDLDAHLVITMPLYLAYGADGAGLTGRYGGEVVVLPMIKTRRRGADGADHDAGLEALVHLLSRRVDFAALFEQGDEAARWIARWSGGCIRHALRMVRTAINEHDDPPVSARSVELAAAVLQSDLDRALPERWVATLKHVAAHNRFPSDCEAEVKSGLLRNLFVLEYQNGDPEPWHAVHPLVERSRKYRDAGD